MDTMTTGELPKSRLQLDTTDSDPLTSAAIPYTSTDGTSIKTLLDRKADKTTNNTLDKNLVVKGSVMCRSFGEIDCADMTTVSPVQVIVDNTAYCGRAQFFSQAAGISNSATLSSCSFPLKYGEYCVVVRAKTSNSTNDSSLWSVEAWESGATQANSIQSSTDVIKCTKFTSTNTYQSFYTIVTHEAKVANPYDKNLYLHIRYFGNGVADLTLDSITVLPIHTAMWDDNDGVMNFGSIL
jgi:hypothetical protein